MKTQIADTMLIALFPILLDIANVKDWVVIIVGILASIWIIIQVVYRIKNWNRK